MRRTHPGARIPISVLTLGFLDKNVRFRLPLLFDIHAPTDSSPLLGTGLVPLFPLQKSLSLNVNLITHTWTNQLSPMTPTQKLMFLFKLELMRLQLTAFPCANPKMLLKLKWLAF